MTSTPAKRRRYSSIKNLLVNDLNSLNHSFAELNANIGEANSDFVLFFKSMEDRQSELFAQTLGIEEKYGNLIDVLKGNVDKGGGQSSTQTLNIVDAYKENERKFVEDTSRSIEGHVRQFDENVNELLTNFKNFETEWLKKIADWKEKKGEMDEQNRTLSGRLLDFSRNI